MTRRQLAIRTIKQASSFLEQQYGMVRTADVKKDGTFVTSADLGAEQLLLRAIQKHFSSDGILSEERGEIKTKNGYRWIIDPLDGTHNFLHGLPLFGTLLALERGAEIIFSICAFPLLNEFFVAEKGKGAFCNEKPIHVSAASTMRGGMCFIDGNKKLPLKRIFADIEGVVSAGCRWRMCGSSAFAMTRVAKGDALVALSRFGTPWDYAAPAFLVKEAGGKVTDSKGKPWTIYSKDLIASNGRAHREALRQFGV